MKLFFSILFLIFCAKTCAKNPVCLEPKVQGHCDSISYRYYYDPERDDCLEFVYGGCDGNGNNFAEREECLDICVDSDDAIVDNENISLQDERENYEDMDYKIDEHDYNYVDIHRSEHTTGLPSTEICLLPKDTGPCQGAAEKYFFNSATKRCETFIYGLCQGNENRFDNLLDCEKRCGIYGDAKLETTFAMQTSTADSKVTEVIKVCFQAVAPGNCHDSQTQYFYNPLYRRCESFIYTGCEGNDNRFPTIENCEETCVKGMEAAQNRGGWTVTVNTTTTNVTKHTNPSESVYESSVAPIPNIGLSVHQTNSAPLSTGNIGHRQVVTVTTNTTTSGLHLNPVCFLPKEQGSCDAYTLNYFYNSDRGECENFYYGGCEGNQNRFTSAEECEATCGSQIKTLQQGNNWALNVNTTSTNVTTNRHPGLSIHDAHIIPGSDGEVVGTRQTITVTTNTTTTSSGLNPLCLLPEDQGSCDAYSIYYFYNHPQGLCQSFYYGGCEGNQNRFANLEDCQETCENQRNSAHQEGGGGWFVNTATKNVTTNVNPGTTLHPVGSTPSTIAEVENKQTVTITTNTTTTSSGLNPLCLLPEDQGSCDSFSIYYFYNHPQGLCQSFYYGGCEGNQNRFANLEDCQEICENQRNSAHQEGGGGWFVSTTTKNMTTNVNPGATLNSIGSTPSTSGKVENKEIVTITTNTTTTSSGLNPLCLLPQDQGPCDSFSIHYFYNNPQGLCQSFYYGGCEGNQNRFVNLEDCQNTCERGIQNSEHQGINWLINVNTTNVTTNSNPSETKYEINPTPVSNLGLNIHQSSSHVNPGATQYTVNRVPSTSGNVGHNQVVTITTNTTSSGSGLNPVCFLPAAPGHCHASFRSIYYNYATKQCESFIYGGCGGNGNRFYTIEECQKTCGGPLNPANHGGGSWSKNTTTSTINRRYPNQIHHPWNQGHITSQTGGIQPSEVCFLPSETGSCRGYLEQYFFNSNSKKCEIFVYGLCDGNANRFNTLQECENMCGMYLEKKTTTNQNLIPGEGSFNVNINKEVTNINENDNSICLLPKSEGPCHDYTEVFYYNPASGKCEIFYYGGCEGNANKFTNSRECESRCIGKTHVQEHFNINPELPSFGIEEGQFTGQIRQLNSHAPQPVGTLPQVIQTPCVPIQGNSHSHVTRTPCSSTPGNTPSHMIQTPYLPTQGNTQSNINVNANSAIPTWGYQVLPLISTYPYGSPPQFTNPSFSNSIPSNSIKFPLFYQPSQPLQVLPVGVTPPQGVIGNPLNFQPIPNSLPPSAFSPYTSPLCTGVGCVDQNKLSEWFSRPSEPLIAPSNPKKNCSVCNKNPVCTKPADSGPCNMFSTRYNFNQATRRCEQFNYGGCAGNENNFVSRELCENTCVKKSACLMPVDSGPCKNFSLRFYYNKLSKRCELFSYGGCLGNRNNFFNQADCERKCKKF